MSLASAFLPFLELGGQIGTGLLNFGAGMKGASAAAAQGDTAMAEARLKALQIDRQGSRVLSSQFAAAGASGVVPTTGSTVAVQLDTARDISLDKLNTLYEGKIHDFYYKSLANERKAKALSGLFGSIGETGGFIYKNRGVLGESWNRISSSVMGSTVTP
jgi:hypothetical protein